MLYDDDDGDGADGADCADGADGEDNNLPSVVAATVGVPPGQDLDALLDTSKSRRGLNSEHEMFVLFVCLLICFYLKFKLFQSQSKKG